MTKECSYVVNRINHFSNVYKRKPGPIDLLVKKIEEKGFSINNNRQNKVEPLNGDSFYLDIIDIVLSKGALDMTMTLTVYKEEMDEGYCAKTKTSNFMLQNMIAVKELCSLDKDILLVEIHNVRFRTGVNFDEPEMLFRKILEVVQETNSVLFAKAIPMYYNKESRNNAIESGKHAKSVKSISEFYKRNNFESINDFIGYDLCDAMLFTGNGSGSYVYDEINKIINK